MLLERIENMANIQPYLHHRILMTFVGKVRPGTYADSKVHGANMGPTWVLSAPDGSHVGPMNLAIRVYIDPISAPVP